MRPSTVACLLALAGCSEGGTRSSDDADAGQTAVPAPVNAGSRDGGKDSSEPFDAAPLTPGEQEAGPYGDAALARPGEEELGAYQGPPSDTVCSSDAANMVACCVLAEVNAFRAEHDLPPYSWEPTLAEAAFAYARTMAETGHFDHFDLEGNGPAERLAKFGVVNVAVGENLHTNPFADMERACSTAVHGDPAQGGGWENSKTGHREIMLGQRPGTGEPLGFTHAAVGAAWNGKSWYISMYVARF